MTDIVQFALSRKTRVMPIVNNSISVTGVFPWNLDSASICIDFADNAPDTECAAINHDNLEN
jgi:hypothetical protein